MKRKETELEKNLILLGYHLSHKTYTGKHSDKVDTYVYVKDNGVIEYSVALDKTREKIINSSFRNKMVLDYTFGILESLQEIHNNFQKELKSLFSVNFTEEMKNRDNQKPTLEDYTPAEPFVEESHFDD